MRNLLIVSLLAIALFPTTLRAEVPHLIRYQGQAVDANGVPLEGPYTLTFRLYEVETGGAPMWEERQDNVGLSKGHFSVLLGQVNVLTAMDWSQPCWLAVQVNGEAELTPRQRITSVPLAITAEKLAVPVTTSTITDDDNSLVPTGAIILWNSAACPAGYTRLSAYDGKFLVGSAAPGSPGGSNTHRHDAGSYAGPSHTHTGTTGQAASQNGSGQVDNQWNPPTHTHPFTTNAGGTGAVTGTSAYTDSRPEFMTILLCQKD